MVNSEKLWSYTCLKIATDSFWTLFAEREEELRDFAMSQSSKFPESFVGEFLERLDRMEKWSGFRDPHYAMARLSMERLVVKKSDPAEFLSSIFILEKKSKRILEKQRQKETKSLTREILEPQIENSVTKFWKDFFLDKPDLRSFAQTHRGDFPESFMISFLKKLDALHWNVSNDPHYIVAAAVMKILTAPTTQLLEEEDALVKGFLVERVAEERAKKVEDKRVKQAEEERKQSQKEEQKRIKEAQEKELKDKKEVQAAFNKTAKARKQEAKKQNQINRLRGNASGLYGTA